MISFDAMLETLKTGTGFWHPLIWIVAMVIAVLIIYLLRSLGNKSFKRKTEQTKSFLSGDPEYEKEQMHIKASNLYWGFTESLKGFYSLLKKMHTGNTSDYVLWFVIVLAILLIIEVI